MSTQPMSSDHSISSIQRRQFLAYSAAGAAGLLLPVQPVVATDIADVWRLMKLHPVRFIAGLVFDVAKAVLVDFASDEIVDWVKGGNRPSRVALGSTDGMESAAEFRHTPYKASTVVLGVADAEVYKQQQLRLLLKDSLQKARFQAMLDYLRAEKIRVALAGSDKSDAVGGLSADDFFTLNYIQMEKHQAEHYRNLIAVTETTAFNNWSV